MENFVTLLIPAILALVLVRLLLLPMKWMFKLAAHCVSGFTGIVFPLNAVTVLTAGILGLPGIALLAVLAII